MSEFKNWMFEPSYDIIIDNPIETKQDLIDTLELLYKLPRPYHLNVVSLKVIPNTRLEQLMIEHKLSIDTISSNYFHNAAILNTVLVNLLTIWRPPRWLFDRLLQNLKPVGKGIAC